MSRALSRRLKATLVVLFMTTFWALPVIAHPIDAASLSLLEVSPGHFELRFQAVSLALQRQLLDPAVFPPHCRRSGTELDCGRSGLVGTIEFPWLEGTLTRLLVDIEWKDGTRQLRVVTPSARSIAVYGGQGAGLAIPILLDYTTLGVDHILFGFDHLFFVVALALLVRGRRRLIATITAFTLAHSLTLAGTALGFLSVPVAPVEAMIALSIVLVSAECLNPEDSLTRRAPWLLAFAFGLLHGFGFASALLEIGLPERHLPLALFSFNVGVEVGQVLVVLGLVGLSWLAGRTQAFRALPKALPARVLAYAMGSVAAFWSIERIFAVLGQ